MTRPEDRYDKFQTDTTACKNVFLISVDGQDPDMTVTMSATGETPHSFGLTERVYH